MKLELVLDGLHQTANQFLHLFGRDASGRLNLYRQMIHRANRLDFDAELFDDVNFAYDRFDSRRKYVVPANGQHFVRAA